MTTYIGEIDELDYAILKVVHAADQALWKNKIHTMLVEQVEELPLIDVGSSQTTGRHVNDLADEGLLQPHIVSPDAVSREMIIGYTITDDGVRVVEQKRSAMLESIVQEKLFSQDRLLPMGKSALVQLIVDEFDIPARFSEKLEAERTYTLMMLLAMQIVDQKSSAVFDREDIVAFYRADPGSVNRFSSVLTATTRFQNSDRSTGTIDTESSS